MTDNNATPTLEVRALSKTFNPGTTVAHRALDGVDLTLAPGEFACIVGSNGAGKSTLFNAVAGSVIPDAGLIRIAGKNVTFDPDYRRARCLSRVFQDPLKGTAPHLTVAENVSLALGRSQKGASLRFAMRKEKRDLIRERRQPHLLLLDEHTAALDPEATERVLQLTDRVVREQGIATLMVTHDLGDALRYGDRTLVMHGGKIVADVSGPERDAMDVDGLLALFRASAGEDLADDKVLLKA